MDRATLEDLADKNTGGCSNNNSSGFPIKGGNDEGNDIDVKESEQGEGLG